MEVVNQDVSVVGFVPSSERAGAPSAYRNERGSGYRAYAGEVVLRSASGAEAKARVTLFANTVPGLRFAALHLLSGVERGKLLNVGVGTNRAYEKKAADGSLIEVPEGSETEITVWAPPSQESLLARFSAVSPDTGA